MKPGEREHDRAQQHGREHRAQVLDVQVREAERDDRHDEPDEQAAHDAAR
jgi:hypothetical protein